MRFFVSILLCSVFSLSVIAQSEELANNYVDQGEYAKAEQIFKKLNQQNPTNLNYLSGLVSSLQQQEKYSEAEEILQATLEKYSFFPGLLVELGYNFQLQGETAQAEKYYQQALEKVEEKPNYAYIVGKAFQQYNLLDQAVQVYEIALETNKSPSYIVQLARIYGEQGKLEQMFDTYLDLIKEHPQYYYAVNKNFAEFITDDPENEANQVLRKLLLKKSQQNPELFYNEMLSWLFVQQNEFNKAFVQEKAIYQRSPEKSLDKIIDLALIASGKEATDTAKEILQYAIDNAISSDEKITANAYLLSIEVKNASPKEYATIDKQFISVLETYGKGVATLSIQLQYAKFLAFHRAKVEEAMQLLNGLLQQRLTRFKEARIKMELADILVLEEKFNQALIYYSQIKHLVNNNEIAQEAGFKVAKTSYYKGDFSWAQTQLKVLKTATSQLIANDAMQLSLLIEDNSLEDSTQTALKLFAKADLYAYQHKTEKSLTILDTILTQHKGEKIEDEALYRKAKLEESQQNYTAAEEAYKKIIQFYGTDILADEAYYFLAELYRTKLNMPEKAKENYEQIIFNFSDSIYYVEARKRYRELRGDAIN